MSARTERLLFLVKPIVLWRSRCYCRPVVLKLPIRELKQRRRRRRRERHKTMGLMSKNNTLHVRFTFWYISLPSSAKQQREITKF